MDAYSKSKLQNKQDAFSAMYMNLCRSILELCGRRAGEGVIREAVRRAGADSGRAWLEELRRANIPTNLHHLYHSASTDPRVRGKQLVDAEDRQVWEIYTCPLADYWRQHRCEKLGSFYCEEYQRARAAAFTEGAGQLNLSKKLTRPEDNFCCFAAFFREANLPAERAKEAFARQGGGAPPAAVSFDERIRSMTVAVYCRLYETAEERFRQEGLCAVAQGLGVWEAEALEALRQKAVRTLQPLDGAFLRENFPLSAGAQPDSEWEKYDLPEAKLLMQRVVLTPLAAACMGEEAEHNGAL